MRELNQDEINQVAAGDPGIVDTNPHIGSFPPIPIVPPPGPGLIPPWLTDGDG